VDRAESVVWASHVSKWFGGVAALDSVDLQAGVGEIHGLLGPNGAGKTTLLSVLFGLTPADEGTIHLFGRSRQEAGAQWLDGVAGFVEAPRFYPYLSGRANLRFLARLDGRDAASLVEDLLVLVGLEGAASERVRGYSLGMRQRLGLAAAMLRRPRLLILDEPTNGMDPAGTRDLSLALRQLADSGLTVVLSSHAMAQVEQLCDTVTVLAKGRVAFAGSLADMRGLAPHPTWRLVTTDDDTALVVGRRMGIDVSPDGGGLHVVATSQRLDALVAALVSQQIGVRSLAEAMAPLEAMFFALTGTRPEVPATSPAEPLVAVRSAP
jgi:ABC-2 type transport system ATP-binding protein